MCSFLSRQTEMWKKNFVEEILFHIMAALFFKYQIPSGSCTPRRIDMMLLIDVTLKVSQSLKFKIKSHISQVE